MLFSSKYRWLSLFSEGFSLGPHWPLFLILGVIVLLAILIVERVSSIPKYPVCFSLIGLKALHIHKPIMQDCSGAWFTFSYLAYLLVDLIGVAVSSALLHYMESSFTRTDSGPMWIRLILMNIGALRLLEWEAMLNIASEPQWFNNLIDFYITLRLTNSFFHMTEHP